MPMRKKSHNQRQTILRFALNGYLDNYSKGENPNYVLLTLDLFISFYL